VQAEDDRGDAVGQANGDDTEWPARVESEPHQRDVVQAVAELARDDREIEPTEIGAPEELERSTRLPAGARLELTRNVEDGIGQEVLSECGSSIRA
jgi:hypothetical protein